MQFKPCYIASENIDKLPFNAGQIILTTDKKGIYFDAAGGDRVPVSPVTNKYTNALSWEDGTSQEITYPSATYTKQEVDDITGDLSDLERSIDS